MAVVAQRHIDATTCNADNVLRTPRVWHIQVEAVHNEDLHVTAAQLCFYNFLSIFSTTLHPDIMATATLPPASDAATSSSSIAAASSSSAEVFKRLHPASYLARFLTKGYRPDGRKLRGWRDVSVNVGSISTANGSALVRLGETTMVCGIKAEVAGPSSEQPRAGYIVPNIDLPALSSPRFKPGPPGDEAQMFSNWLNDLLVSSDTVPLEGLCICPGKAVWALYIDVVCINYDGNAFDAAVMAVMAALRNRYDRELTAIARLPGATYNDDSGQTICSRTETFPLQLGRTPLSCSFGIFQSSHLLPDPTSFETPLLPTTVTVALDERGVAALVREEGLGGVVGKTGEAVISEAWDLAEERVKELRAILEESTAQA
ncbi:hypothetical protein EHS25_006078 [Saitozyma podzolica]|uniref:Ribosomal RNA-processing protein 43 n=1 Tax=Saitozyma podzolica TaxID=1890683 RepID=A0A427XTL5_9TREE|nr:hypothetical protein EHS25_006078 [Saitozyma podzolica]